MFKRKRVKTMKVTGTICFPDDPRKHMETLKNLINYYIKVDGSAGDVMLDIVVEDERLVIDVSKGFHCLSIPLEDLRKIIGESEC